ncbi:hypothetical protein [Flavobacterium sp. HTF]|uniref:hypothetical protein n=1 Tax=Flavobacterium sp. HTF TaxID=2170732 RepID=UPI000D5CC5EB|nr:hypothetical protein [Flavobacterium sp. HTF]PWB23621.1 hypothetical protein DCO46_14185 [Flavobacterium sp. HTF]
MKGPITYSEWTILLDKFGNGDDAAIEELNIGSFIVDAGTATRFYTKVEEIYKKRKQSWLDNFQRSFHFQNFKTEDEFEIALRNAKKNLSPLIKFVLLKGFPEDLKKTLKKDLEDFIIEIKTSLKNNVSKISKGRDKMLILLNAFEISIISEEPKIDVNNNFQNTNEIIAPMGRKIIF